MSISPKKSGAGGAGGNKLIQIILVAVIAIVGYFANEGRKGGFGGGPVKSSPSNPSGGLKDSDLSFDPSSIGKSGESGKSGNIGKGSASASGSSSALLPDLPNALIIDAKCVHVVDGDTIRAVDGKRKNWNVRILGIDTMETHQKDKAAQQGRRHGHSTPQVFGFGNKAKSMASSMLKNKQVQLVMPLGKIMTDPHGRLLAYVHVNGQDYGSAILQAGLAEARRESHARKGMYHRMVDQARKAKLGIYQ